MKLKDNFEVGLCAILLLLQKKNWHFFAITY